MRRMSASGWRLKMVSMAAYAVVPAPRITYW